MRRTAQKTPRARRAPRAERPRPQKAPRSSRPRDERWLVRRLLTPLARRLRSRNIATVTLLSIAAVVLYAVLVPVHTALYGTFLPYAMVLGAAAVGAPLVGLRRPALAVGLFLGAAVLLPLLTSHDASSARWPWPWSVPMLIAFSVFIAAMTFEHGWRRGLVLLAAGAAASLLPVIVLPQEAPPNAVLADLVVTTSVAVIVLLIATLIAGRVRVGDELLRERAQTAQEQARRELVEERTRIARELHDIVAHSMSLIQVQSSTARYRLPRLADDAAAEFDGIAATARGSLTEMRRILGVLRTEDHTAELAPQHGLDDIPALVETTRRAGADVVLAGAVDGDADAAVQVAAYRIAQEALSNAVRHAAGAPITVLLRADAGTVSVQVRNAPVPGEPPAPAPGRGGHGLRGMAERAELLGGEVVTGADEDGGWTVAARLPRHPRVQEGTP
ncbi:histidine kinase [Microbacterium sp.]|uniref:sensor histidine kinase n=1 Tax=Microbacterium sp. TaxID=51671 RepID=UPI0033427E33